MQDLRLIGVDDDGGHLVLAAADGARFRVPLDESLRAAARRDRPRLGQLQIEIEGGLRPRDVQAMVRAGMSAEEVAERSGWTVEKVHKYEGPILAEREYVAGLGRAVRLRRRGSSGTAVSLGQRVAERLASRGVAAESLEWDSWRREGPAWTVAVSFPAGGRQRQATWSFDVASRALQAKDDEARWLSEDEPAAPIVPRDVPVYDVEADGGLDADGRRRPRPEAPVDLVSAMRERSTARSRRGSARRRQLEPVAALPLDDASTASPTVSEPTLEPVIEFVERAEPVVEPTARPVVEATLEPAGPATIPKPDERPDEAATPGDAPEAEVDSAAAPEADAAPSAPPVRHTARRPGRTSVPSWDDIVFGTKPKTPRD